MTTRVTFDIDTNDAELLEALADSNIDDVTKWRLAVFCSQQQLERALRAQAIRQNYASIRERARATRQRRLQGDANPEATHER